MVLEYAMAVLGAKKVFGLVSAGTSTVRRVGFFVCFDVPKKTIRFCFRTQKEIILFPFRFAGITYKAVSRYWKPKQSTKNSPGVSENYESDENNSSSSSVEELASTSPIEDSSDSSESNSDCENNDKRTLVITNDRESSQPAKLDALTVLTNGNTDAKEVAKQTKALLTTSLQSIHKLEKWRLEKQKRILNASEVCSFRLPDEDMFQSLQMEKELYHGLCATWNYCKALKAKREEIGADFNKKAKTFFSKAVPNGNTFKPVTCSSKERDLLTPIMNNHDIETATVIFEHGLQICRKGTDKKALLTDIDDLKSVVKRVIGENDVLRSRMDTMNEKLKEVTNFSSDLKAEVTNLTNQYRNMTITEEKLNNLQQHLNETRDFLYKAEIDRDDMAWKLETLAKMINEEEDFLDNGTYNATKTSLSSAHAMESKKIN